MVQGTGGKKKRTKEDTAGLLEMAERGERTRTGPGPGQGPGADPRGFGFGIGVLRDGARRRQGPR